jgi:hypothetical protein
MKDMHKTLLRIWLVLWVLTLPLVHIHPEVDHAHGMSGHVHGGTYHSILVNTPVHAHQGYDQEEHHHDGFFALEGHRGSEQDPLYPFHGFEEATYGFSVIKPTIVLESEKSQVTHDVVVAEPVEVFTTFGISKPNLTIPKQFFSLLPEILSPRAPPVLSI